MLTLRLETYQLDDRTITWQEIFYAAVAAVAKCPRKGSVGTVIVGRSKISRGLSVIANLMLGVDGTLAMTVNVWKPTNMAPTLSTTNTSLSLAIE